MQQLKIRLLEQRLCRPIRVRTVRNDNVELVLAVSQELEAVAHMRLNLWMLVPYAHAGQVLLGEADDGFVDVAEDCGFDGRVLDDFAQDAAVAAAYDEDFLGGGMRVHGEVGDHFLVASDNRQLQLLQSLGWDSKDGESLVSTYANSSRSVHWMTLSSTRTVP